MTRSAPSKEAQALLRGNPALEHELFAFYEKLDALLDDWTATVEVSATPGELFVRARTPLPYAVARKHYLALVREVAQRTEPSHLSFVVIGDGE